MYSQHTAPWFACAAGTLQPAGDDGWCPKGFSPYFLPLSGKTQFIASHSAGLRCSGSLQGVVASGAEWGWERTPGLS